MRGIAIALLILCPVKGFAQVSHAFLDRLKDRAVTLEIESRLADAMRNNDKKALTTLRKRIEVQDGAALNQIMADALSDDNNEAAIKLALLLSPCQYAGLAIRGLAIGIAKGTIQYWRQERFLLTKPESVEELFTDNIRRCELLGKIPYSKREIGTNCIADGKNCFAR